MENANDFVEQSILDLVKKFENIQASLHFEPLINAYYIEIKPKNFLSNSTELKASRLEIQEKLYALNADSTLLFIAEGAVPGLSSFSSTVIGIAYLQTVTDSIPDFSNGCSNTHKNNIH